MRWRRGDEARGAEAKWPLDRTGVLSAFAVRDVSVELRLGYRLDEGFADRLLTGELDSLHWRIENPHEGRAAVQ